MALNHVQIDFSQDGAVGNEQEKHEQQELVWLSPIGRSLVASLSTDAG